MGYSQFKEDATPVEEILRKEGKDMTVSELIEILKMFDGTLPVYRGDSSIPQCRIVGARTCPPTKDIFTNRPLAAGVKLT